jgi:SAM-dependent methyltransferase
LLAFVATAHAQERFSIFVGSDIEDVRRMLVVVGLRDGDVVYDLGSGDGRIVLEAARMNAKVVGRGIEIDEKLVREATAAAKSQGVADRVRFIHQDAFLADLGGATVITMWLFPELMRLLRPKILAEAAPGTRVVTRTWDLGGWKPDTVNNDGAPVSVWVVPARIEGDWSWTLALDGVSHGYAALMEQRFQEAEGVVRVGNRRGILEDVKLNGEQLSFTLEMSLAEKQFIRHRFSGRVRGDAIEGTVSIFDEQGKKSYVLPWRATRARGGSPGFLLPARVETK